LLLPPVLGTGKHKAVLDLDNSQAAPVVPCFVRPPAQETKSPLRRSFKVGEWRPEFAKSVFEKGIERTR
jgi:hypothetical protein